jgi:hypothetical protein
VQRRGACQNFVETSVNKRKNLYFARARRDQEKAAIKVSRFFAVLLVSIAGSYSLSARNAPLEDKLLMLQLNFVIGL